MTVPWPRLFLGLVFVIRVGAEEDEWEPPRLKAQTMHFAPFASTELTPEIVTQADVLYVTRIQKER